MQPARHFSIALVVFGFVAGISGCGGDDEGESLEGTKWTMVSGVDMPPGVVPTLEFDSGDARGSLVCNFYGAPYEVDGGSIEIGQIAMTAVGCPGQETEEPYLSVFGEVDGWSIEGDRELVLTSGGDELLRYAQER